MKAIAYQLRDQKGVDPWGRLKAECQSFDPAI
jgi:hypothetical protein